MNYIPTCSQFRSGIQAFSESKKGTKWMDVYKKMQLDWPDTLKVAYRIAEWLDYANRRFADFDAMKLSNCIERNLKLLSTYRVRRISSLAIADESSIQVLFNEFMDALETVRGNKSTVSVAKAFSLIAPDFLPMWDKEIAEYYVGSHVDSGDYIEFCHKMRPFYEEVKHCINTVDDRPLLKRIDEYNMAKYTL